MTGRLEVSCLGVAFLAAERVLDLVVAHQAIGHLRHVDLAHGVRFFQAAMASFAGVPGVEMATDVAGVGEVVLLIDRGSENGRDVAHLEMERVAEVRHRGRGWRGDPDLALLVAGGARGFRREQIVLGPGARLRGGVALGAVGD